ncbi:hypothetical protein, partial [Klebsiella pneumoniae]|uniref:hypothetical protein n=1 Tax=Klebsiella pneumoniae TaxID=573 RepID=UPI0015F2CF80
FLKVSLELSFHICVEHVYLLGFKHHHASGLCGYLDAACIMVRGRKSGAAAPEELGEFPKYFASEQGG